MCQGPSKSKSMPQNSSGVAGGTEDAQAAVGAEILPDSEVGSLRFPKRQNMDVGEL